MSKTQEMISSLQAIVAGPFTIDAALAGSALHGSIENQWLADYRPKDHPGTLPVTYGVYRREYEDLGRAGEAVKAQVEVAKAAYLEWHQVGRAQFGR